MPTVSVVPRGTSGDPDKKDPSISDRLRQALDPRSLHQLPQALIDATFAAAAEVVGSSFKENGPIDESRIGARFEAGAGSGDPILRALALDESVFGFEAGMEFDAEAQRNFEDLLCRNIGGFGNRLAGQAFDRMIRNHFAKLMRRHAFTSFEAGIHVRAVNLTSGAELSTSFKEQIKRMRKFAPQAGGVAGQFSTCCEFKHEASGSLGVIPLRDWDLIEVTFSLSRGTGVRAWVKEGLLALEEARPIAKVAGASCGSLGEKGGAIADEALLRFLQDRFLSEEQIIPNERFRFVFYRRDDLSDIAESIASRKGGRKARLGPGRIFVELYRGEQTISFPLLEI